MKRLLGVVLAAFCSLFAQAQSAAPPAGAALVVTLDGAIGPATVRQVDLGLQQAEREGASVMVLRLDTPGGLDASMREIVRAVLASPLPVLGYVGPPGARAASAGTVILYATHLAAMAPGTNLGAATPVRHLQVDWQTRVLSALPVNHAGSALLLLGLAALAFCVLVLRLAVRGRKLRSHSGAEALVGETARVLDWSADTASGHVLLAGERWQAHGEAVLQPGQTVRVEAVHGLRVQVSRTDAASAADPRLPSSTL